MEVGNSGVTTKRIETECITSKLVCVWRGGGGQCTNLKHSVKQKGHNNMNI